MPFGELEFVVKILGALAAGSLIGLERTYHGRPAGFRTHALVCMASAALMLLNDLQTTALTATMLETIRTDPTRMAQGIMTGIGFLGAGLIFREGATVRGLTTAASIWITAAIGILFGVAYYPAAILTTVLVLGVLAVFDKLEDLIPGQIYTRQILSFEARNAMSEDELRKMLGDFGFSLRDLTYALTEDGRKFEYRVTTLTRDRENIGRVAEHLRGIEKILEFQISPTGDEVAGVISVRSHQNHSEGQG